MTAKEYLSRARTLDCEIKSKQRELSKLKLNAQYLCSPNLGEKVINSQNSNVNSSIDKAIDLESVIKSEIACLVNLQSEIHTKIEALQNSKHRIVLTDFYITCMTLEQSAEYNNYSMSQIKRYLKTGIEEFENLYGFPKDEPK